MALRELDNLVQIGRLKREPLAVRDFLRWRRGAVAQPTNEGVMHGEPSADRRVIDLNNLVGEGAPSNSLPARRSPVCEMSAQVWDAIPVDR